MKLLARWLAACLVLLSAACTAASRPAPSTRTDTRTVIATHTLPRPTPTFTPPPAHAVAPLPPGAQPPSGEVERPCPYIASSPDQNAKTNVADIDGSHVYRTTVLTRLRPPGCRFYFYAPPYEAIADIVPRRFDSATAAHNALVLTARAGSQAIGRPDIAPGVDAVLYRTRFFGPDGSRDWACAFAAGATMVIVHTQRTDTSLNALLLARAIARKF